MTGRLFIEARPSALPGAGHGVSEARPPAHTLPYERLRLLIAGRTSAYTDIAVRRRLACPSAVFPGEAAARPRVDPFVLARSGSTHRSGITLDGRFAGPVAALTLLGAPLRSRDSPGGFQSLRTN